MQDLNDPIAQPLSMKMKEKIEDQPQGQVTIRTHHSTAVHTRKCHDKSQ